MQDIDYKKLIRSLITIDHNAYRYHTLSEMLIEALKEQGIDWMEL